MKQLSKSFFNKSTKEIAKALLGCYLVHETKEGRAIGKIVETEAYLKDDPASHSFPGLTKRNAIMFSESGNAYIYFTYGMYHCFNVVTNKPGIGEAVLIRSLEPLEGLDLMKERRKTKEIKNLCSGPAKLVQALGIKPHHNGISLLSGNLKLLAPKKQGKFIIEKSRRIGITKGTSLPHRFYIKDNDFVSN